MKLTLKLDGDGAAFEDEPATELARILEDTARRIRDNGQTHGSLRDVNGNTCGARNVQ